MGGITSYIFLVIVAFVIGVLVFRLKADKRLFEKKPFSFSVVALSLIVLNWLLFLSAFYTVIPDQVSDMIFSPIWFLVCIIGLIAAFKEYKNNLFIALLTAGLSIISLMIGGFLFLIGSM